MRISYQLICHIVQSGLSVFIGEYILARHGCQHIKLDRQKRMFSGVVCYILYYSRQLQFGKNGKRSGQKTCLHEKALQAVPIACRYFMSLIKIFLVLAPEIDRNLHKKAVFQTVFASIRCNICYFCELNGRLINMWNFTMNRLCW